MLLMFSAQPLMTTLSVALGVTCAPAGHAMTIARSAIAAIHIDILEPHFRLLS